ncbi:Short-chain dehydrogenase, partial [Trichostrongylus colubriformis]
RTRGSIIDAGVPEERVSVVIGDLTEEEVRIKIVESTVARWGHLDVLVNNAGASITYGKPGFEASDDAYMETMNINLRSVIQLVRLARPHLIRSKGEIVNVSSIAALNFGITHDPYYAISKAGLDQLTRGLAVDLIGYGVRVNGVSPGIVETSFMVNNGLTKEQSEKVCAAFFRERYLLAKRLTQSGP